MEKKRTCALGIAALLFSLGCVTVTTGCKEEGKAEDVGKAVDDAAEDLGDAAEDIADDLSGN